MRQYFDPCRLDADDRIVEVHELNFVMTEEAFAWAVKKWGMAEAGATAYWHSQMHADAPREYIGAWRAGSWSDADKEREFELEMRKKAEVGVTFLRGSVKHTRLLHALKHYVTDPDAHQFWTAFDAANRWHMVKQRDRDAENL